MMHVLTGALRWAFTPTPRAPETPTTARGAQASDAGEQRIAPAWVLPHLRYEWLAGYDDAQAAVVEAGSLLEQYINSHEQRLTD